ncbi:M48 family metallopeptidase [Halobacteriovorax sp. HLS]|uniref:M48 family metallopeptidase n=1 Tax=Halobacteriovorax sp. HLS TaxID=2234000 RepID=UPI000FD74F33|nr:M48 family metallopeptidase [Halobacteriovorax sp. HLS]
MKYNPANTERDNNISEGNDLVGFFKYLFGTVLIILITVFTISILSSVIINSFSDPLESTLHNKMFNMFNLNYKQSKKEENIQSLLNSLIEVSDMKQKKFQIRIVSSKDQNAMASIGGRITIYDELLRNIETENSLALVLAHELGHYKMRHHLQGIGPIITISILNFVTPSMKDLIEKVFFLGMMKVSRDHETEADQYAIELMINRYGHLDGALTFFRNVEKIENKYPSIAKFLSGHPATQERIDLFEQQAKKYKDEKNEITVFSLEE